MRVQPSSCSRLYSKTSLKRPLKIDKTKIFIMTNGSLMKVSLKKTIFGLLFDWPPKTGFTVHV